MTRTLDNWSNAKDNLKILDGKATCRRRMTPKQLVLERESRTPVFQGEILLHIFGDFDRDDVMPFTLMIILTLFWLNSSQYFPVLVIQGVLEKWIITNTTQQE
jgi:hypothetical protein